MYIHYFIILHGFIVVISSTNNRPSLILIINSVKSRPKLFSYSIPSTTNRITTHNCHSDILSQWLRHSFSNIKVHLHIISNKCNLDKNLDRHGKLRHFINDDNKIPSIFSRKLQQILLNKKNRTVNLMEMNKSNNQNSLISTKVNRVVNTTGINKNANRTRIRRDFLRENTIDDGDDTNVYDDDDDESRFRNHKKEIAEQKRGFNDEYYRPIENKLKMSKLS